MANKLYTEFPAGTYDTSKIFLQADAVTGDLEKVNLPATSSTSVIAWDATNRNSNGTTDQILVSLAIPANTLHNDGDSISGFFLNSQGPSGSGNYCSITFAGTSIGGEGNSSTNNFNFTFIIIRTSASTARCQFLCAYDYGNISYQVSDLSSQDFTTSNNLNLVVTSDTASSIINRMAQVLVQKAA